MKYISLLFIFAFFVLYQTTPVETARAGLSVEIADQYIYLPLVSKPIPMGTDQKRISASSWHTCAITTSGGVKCWGWNTSGELGNGKTGMSRVAVPVSGLSSGVVSIAAGYDFSCALTAAGGVKCWGNNAYGQLGNGRGKDSAVPVNVTGLQSGVTSIAAGFNGACAITSDGTEKCWGAALDGKTIHTVPGDVTGIPPEISAGAVGVTMNDGLGATNCVLTSYGEVRCLGTIWLSNEQELLGAWLPWKVSGIPTSLRAVALGGPGALLCGLTALQSGIVCMAHDASFYGVPGLETGAAAVSVGRFHACALTDSGGVKCWGTNIWGNLGDNTTTDRDQPVDVTGLTSGVVEISAGGFHSCALLANGKAKCWGNNSQGELGNGQVNYQVNIPTDVIQFP